MRGIGTFVMSPAHLLGVGLSGRRVTIPERPAPAQCG